MRPLPSLALFLHPLHVIGLQEEDRIVLREVSVLKSKMTDRGLTKVCVCVCVAMQHPPVSRHTTHNTPIAAAVSSCFPLTETVEGVSCALDLH